MFKFTPFAYLIVAEKDFPIILGNYLRDIPGINPAYEKQLLLENPPQEYPCFVFLESAPANNFSNTKITSIKFEGDMTEMFKRLCGVLGDYFDTTKISV